ncbi:unnamed protein product [Brassica napus]|uniref:(rape) hypothetical protein n=1 Tax=Brassica napus TaxID=3708 RepID=A0A816J690_BRANA|nr:unnamed protein product [Brassica napus]
MAALATKQSLSLLLSSLLLLIGQCMLHHVSTGSFYDNFDIPHPMG